MSCSTSHRDFSALEGRRLQACGLFRAGELRLADIARRLRVSRQSVSRWYAQWQKGGARALRAAGRAGRKPRLTPRQLQSVVKGLRQGLRVHGIAGDSWTLPRAAQLIEQVTGVRYHPGHVWKMLGALNWEAAGLSGSGSGKEPAGRKWLAIKRMLQGKEHKRR